MSPIIWKSFAPHPASLFFFIIIQVLFDNRIAGFFYQIYLCEKLVDHSDITHTGRHLRKMKFIAVNLARHAYVYLNVKNCSYKVSIGLLQLK